MPDVVDLGLTKLNPNKTITKISKEIFILITKRPNNKLITF